MDEIVTYFSTYKGESIIPVPLEEVLRSFQCGAFSKMITKVRTILDSDGEDAYKIAKKSLPAIAFCGEFVGGHAKSNLVKYNGLLVFDIDHLDNAQMTKAARLLKADEHILSFWVSPSGNGYKGLIRLFFENTSDELSLDTCYKKAFADATHYFKEHFQLELDKSCSDFSRICYVCWDEHLYQNENASPLVVDCGEVQENNMKDETGNKPAQLRSKTTFFKPVNVAGKNAQHSRDVISSIIKFLSKRNLSITATYEEWLRVGFAIANTFNYDLGLKYFLALSKLDKGRYDEVACIEKLQECYMNGNGDVSLGSIIDMARKIGYNR